MIVLAIIPARGQSKRIPHKNIIDLNGIPLIGYSIKAGLEATLVDQVLVTTDDKDIAKISKKLGAEVQFPRPAELSGDHDILEDVLRYIINTYDSEYQPDIVILLQPTSPFRTAKHINEALDLFLKSGADTVTAVHRVSEHPYYLWKLNGDQIEPFYSFEEQKASRHILPPFYIENGSIYIIKKDVLLNDGLYGKRVIPYEMNLHDSIDIDDPIDLEWARFLLSKS